MKTQKAPKRWARVYPRKDPIGRGYTARLYEGRYLVSVVAIPECEETPTDEDAYRAAWDEAEAWSTT